MLIGSVLLGFATAAAPAGPEETDNNKLEAGLVVVPAPATWAAAETGGVDVAVDRKAEDAEDREMLAIEIALELEELPAIALAATAIETDDEVV